MRHSCLLLLVLAHVLLPCRDPAAGQETDGAGDDGPPRVGVFVGVDTGLFLDIFATDGALVPVLGGVAAVEVPLGDRWALRGDGDVLVGLSDTRAGQIDRGEAIILLGPGLRFYLADGPGDRPHLRFGVAVDPNGVLPRLGLGVPVAGTVRLRLRTSGVLSTAGLSIGLR